MRLIAFILGILAGIFAYGPVHISGVLMTETGNQDRRPGTWRSTIQYLDPERNMFTQLLTRLPTKKVTDPEYKLFERERRSRWIRSAEALDASETVIDVATGFGGAFSQDDIVMVPETGERIKVTSVATDALTVVRGALGTTATATSSGTTPWLKVLYERQEENGRSGTPLTTDYTTVNNFTQIFKHTYGVSRTNKNTKKRGPKDLSEERSLSLLRYKEDLEQMIIWGIKRQEVSSGDTYRYSGGFNEFVTTNRVDLDGAMGYGDISWLVNKSTRYGGSKKLWFCGRDARMQLDTLGLDYMRIGPKDNILGMAVDGVRTSFGEFMLITHHGLENYHADLILIVDPMHIALAQFMAMKHETNIQENDRDGEKHQFIGEHGLWLDTEKAHTWVYGAGGQVV